MKLLLVSDRECCNFSVGWAILQRDRGGGCEAASICRIPSCVSYHIILTGKQLHQLFELKNILNEWLKVWKLNILVAPSVAGFSVEHFPTHPEMSMCKQLWAQSSTGQCKAAEWGFIFFFLCSCGLAVGRGPKVTDGGQRGDGRAGRADLTEWRLLGIPTPSPLSVGGNVTPASLQASVLPVYWLFYTVKLNKAELQSCKHLRTYITFSKSELATFISCESTWLCS